MSQELQDYLYRFLLKHNDLPEEDYKVLKAQVDRLILESQPLYAFTKELGDSDKKFKSFMQVFEKVMKGKI